MKTVEECNIFAFFLRANISQLTKVAENNDVKDAMALPAHSPSLPVLSLGKSRKQQHSRVPDSKIIFTELFLNAQRPTRLLLFGRQVALETLPVALW